ncbi:MAG: hypothetical protein H5T86_15980, partial [Armatimonadetes bacterium]|nr:hypothetical protein [Armatimonadota bacterium]
PAKEDGLYPDSGASGSTEFIWEVVYRDADGDAPRYVGLLLFLDGRELPESPIIMEPVPGGDVTRGKTYRVSRRLTQLGKWEYRFVASDGYAPATGAPTQRRQAPTVTGGIELAYPRVGPLGDRGQMPAVGTPGLTPFSFYVTYRHVEGTAPQWVRVKIRLANSATNVKSFGMTALDGADFRVGRTYSRTVELDGTPCTYWFEASDGKAVCRTDELPGPAFNHAPTVEWAGGQHWTNTGVYPASGDLTTSFEFRVLYRDPDGDPPAQAYVIVYRPDDPRSQQVVWLSPLASGNVDYRAGVVYQAFLKPGQAGSYRYTFRLNDGYAQATGPPALEHDGPSVAATGTSIVALTGVVACAGPRLATVRCTTSVDNCQVRGSVLNVAGRKVADLLLLRQDRREVVLAWNYTNAAGSRVPPGRYMILLEAASPCGSLARAVTVLQVGGR